MTKTTREEILNNAYEFFFKMFHDKTKKYAKRKFEEFTINPFTIQATAQAFGTKITAHTIALAVVYPFALGTSMATSFGTNVQSFIVTTMGNGIARPSVVSGMDIEYTDFTDGREKYCQLKAGPNTINKDDIDTIEGHFTQLRNLARTNKLPIEVNDAVLGVLYGNPDDLSSMYKTIESHGNTVLIGEDFWFHLTGMKGLYGDLITQGRRAAKNSRMEQSIDAMIHVVEEGVEKNAELFGLS